MTFQLHSRHDGVFSGDFDSMSIKLPQVLGVMTLRVACLVKGPS